MNKIKKLLNYFSRTEKIVLFSSLTLIIVSFLLFDRENYLTLIASLLGAVSLIFNAKGNPFGQVLIIIFAFIYGYISYGFGYYGEMLTYLGMSAPMATFSLIAWLRNPYKGKRSEVTIATLKAIDVIIGIIFAIAVTIIFYFILAYFNTANLIVSTLSVTTSFFAAYFLFRRSPYFALAYAVNDIVLIILWVLASIEDMSYISVVICFASFLLNDMYSFINWIRMRKRQNEGL
ncbi:MAG: nicotinamide mononucleotide transporter [Clostridia bacterium]|nr:nicotinamide mononucleotide transporter [Clostridia bacterium]